jgi:hypothetical protein
MSRGSLIVKDHFVDSPLDEMKKKRKRKRKKEKRKREGMMQKGHLE